MNCKEKLTKAATVIPDQNILKKAEISGTLFTCYVRCISMCYIIIIIKC